MSGRRWTWVVAWAVLIEGLIIWPHPPALPQAIDVTGADKLVHAALFGVQAALAVRASGGGKDSHRWWPAFVGTVVFGAFTECEQYFIPSRSMELGDFLADSIGAAVGAAIVVLRARKRRELRA